MATDNGVNEVGMKALEGYLENLAAAATNAKSVLDQLVTNNTKLTRHIRGLGGNSKKIVQRE